MWRGFLRILVVAIGGIGAGGAHADPCASSSWIAAPILLLESNQAAAPVAIAASDGIGGTGHRPDGIGGTGLQDGIGGTGRARDDGIGGTGHRPDGIGGTGHRPDGIGGTGFVGVVAAFGSICVNGVEIAYDAATKVEVDGRPSAANSLALGQIVAVTTQGSGTALRASRIAIQHAVVGPVQAVDAAAGKIRVLGQSVELPAAAVASLKVGDTLAIDGNRLPDGTILATRVERAVTAHVSVAGPVTAVDKSGFHIQDLPVQLAPSNGASMPQLGQEVRVQGALTAGTLVADAVAVPAQFGFDAAVTQLDLQGYVRSARTVGLNVDGTDLVVNAQTALPNGEAPSVGARVHVFAAARPGGGFVAERVRIERPPRAEAAAARIRATPREAARTERGEAGERARPHGGEDAGKLSPPDLMRPNIERPQLERPQIERPEVVRPEEM